MNCNGCGVVLDPTEEQVNAAVDQVLDSSLADAHHHGGVCPLCGHSKKVPYWNRKTLLFGLLVICLMTLTWITVSLRRRQETERATAVKMVLARYPNGDVYKYSYTWSAKRTYAEKVLEGAIECAASLPGRSCPLEYQRRYCNLGVRSTTL